MPTFVLIGLAAGLASAVLLASSHRGNPGASLLLFFLTPLPMFLAGLGWGTIAAIISGVSASLSIAAFFGLGPKLVHFMGQAAAVVALCHLAQLSRPVPAPDGNGAPGDGGGREWYPVGRMLAWASLMAGLLALLTALSVAIDLDGMRATLRELLVKVFIPQFPIFRDKSPNEAELTALTEMMLFSLPAASASVWLASLVLNLYLGGRITLASGRLARPWPDIAGLDFPRGFGFALAAALAGLLVLAGYPKLIASGLTGALLLAYALLGLAILHYGTRGNMVRPLILAGVYFAILLLNVWALLALALLGALEPLLAIRRRKDARPPD